MTVPRLDIEFDVTPAIAQVNRIAGRFSNWVPLAGGRLDVAIRGFLKRRFDSEGRVGGTKWVKLSPGYAAFKKFRAPRKRILQFGGQMMEAFTKRNAEHQILRTGPDFYSLTVDETIAPRARAHQKGEPKTHLPRRPIIPDRLPKNFIEELKRVTRSYIVRGET